MLAPRAYVSLRPPSFLHWFQTGRRSSCGLRGWSAIAHHRRRPNSCNLIFGRDGIGANLAWPVGTCTDVCSRDSDTDCASCRLKSERQGVPRGALVPVRVAFRARPLGRWGSWAAGAGAGQLGQRGAAGGSGGQRGQRGQRGSGRPVHSPCHVATLPFRTCLKQDVFLDRSRPPSAAAGTDVETWSRGGATLENSSPVRALCPYRRFERDGRKLQQSGERRW